MAPALQLKWHGLDRFQEQLKTLTPDLAAESAALMQESAEQAEAVIRQTYPRGKTGNLRKGLVVRPSKGKLLSGARLISRAPHAHLYERGTVRRQNKAGANRGYVKPHPTFEPIAEAHQTEAVEAIVQRLYQHGATRVTGT